MILGSLQAHASRQLIDNHGVCPTIGTTDFGLPKVIEKMENEELKPKVIGKLKYNSNFDCGARIYDTDGIAPTQQTITGGNLETKIIEYMDNKEQKEVEMNEWKTIVGSKQTNAFRGHIEDISPSITSAMGMGGGQIPLLTSASIEESKTKLFMEQIRGHKQDTNNEQQQEPTIGAIRTRSYKGQPATLEQSGATESNAITSVQKDNVVVEPINATEDGLATTLTTAHHYAGNIVNPKRGQTEMGVKEDFRIRKLTPRECFRLMDVSEPDIDKLLNAGISNSQLYKLAGNSIVVNVLYHIFRKMFIETDMDNTGKPQQLNLF